MSRNTEDDWELQFGSDDLAPKTLHKNDIKKVVLTTLKTQSHDQHDYPSSQSQISNCKLFQHSPNFNSTPKPMLLKQSKYRAGYLNPKKSHYQQSKPSQQPNQKYKKLSQSQNHLQNKLNLKIQFLQHTINQYKQQLIAINSKLQQKQKYFYQTTLNYQNQINHLKQQLSTIQKQIQGQSNLIQQCHQKYDIQVKERLLCLKVIDQQNINIQSLNHQINTLQRAVASTREVSVNLIKENENLKAEILIEKEKYELLFQDYGCLSENFEQEIKEMCDENRLLIRKLDDVEIELKIYQKDEEIQNLLTYQNSINKRQRELISLDQASSSPPSVIYQPSKTSPYEYRPRRLNFQDDNTQSGKNVLHDKGNKSDQGFTEIIQLQKSRISHLENQLKQMENRNKELQTLMVKFMK